MSSFPHVPLSLFIALNNIMSLFSIPSKDDSDMFTSYFEEHSPKSYYISLRNMITKRGKSMTFLMMRQSKQKDSDDDEDDDD